MTRRGHSDPTAPSSPDSPHTVRDARRERLVERLLRHGLAGLAGGWPGSEDLVSELDALRRSPPRPSPDLG